MNHSFLRWLYRRIFKRNRPRYYLAHPYELREKVRFQELQLEELLPIELANPFYDQKWKQKLMTDLDKNVGNEFFASTARKITVAQSPEQIVTEDCREIAKSDGIIVYLPNRNTPSGGAWMETWIASHMFPKRRVIIVTENLDTHYWLRYCTDRSKGFFTGSLLCAALIICAEEGLIDATIQRMVIRAYRERSENVITK